MDPDQRLQPVYRSGFYAPMAGAYDAIRAFPLPHATGRLFRVVFGSSGGVFAFDVLLPETFTPGLEVSCP